MVQMVIESENDCVTDCVRRLFAEGWRGESEMEVLQKKYGLSDLDTENVRIGLRQMGVSHGRREDILAADVEDNLILCEREGRPSVAILCDWGQEDAIKSAKRMVSGLSEDECKSTTVCVMDCLSRNSYKTTDDGEILIYPHGRILWVGGGDR